VWLHEGRGWRQELALDATAVRVAPDGTLLAGATPPAVQASMLDGSWAEWTALQNMLRYQRLRMVGKSGGREVAGIAFASSGTVVAVAGAGAFLTLDDGRSWSPHFEGLDPEVHGIWEHPERAHRLYAATASGFYRSEDGGYSWVQSLSGVDRPWCTDVAVLPGAPDTLLLAASHKATGEGSALFRSPNGGVNWSLVRLGDDDEWEQPVVVSSLGSPVEAFFVVAGGRAWGSHDRGEHWLPIAEGVPPAHALCAAVGAW
jgi:hypothetical protein